MGNAKSAGTALPKTITKMAFIVEAATPDEMTRIAEMLASSAPWAMPIFTASAEQADRLEALLARCNGIAIERIRSAEDLEARLNVLRQDGRDHLSSSWLSGLLRLSLTISSIQDQDSLLEELLRQAMAMTNAVHGCVYLVDETDSLLQHKACAPSEQEAHKALPPGLPEWVQENRKALLITAGPDLSLPGYTRPAQLGVIPLSIRIDRRVRGEALAIPLMAANRLLGVLCLQAAEPRQGFSGDQFEALSVMAAQVGMSLDGTRLFTRVQQGKKEWEATFDAIGEAVFLISPGGRILRANQAAARAAGRRFTQLVGERCCEAVSGMDHPPDGCPLQQVLQTHRPASAEITDRDGSRIRHVAIYPIFDARGEIQAVVEYSRDITQIKAAQARLMQAEKLSALGELTAGVAHELNNPLTSILGFVQLLQRTELSDRQASYLSVIHDETRRAARIVRNLLTFARRQEPEKKMLDINNILEETLSLLAYQLRVSGVKVEQGLDPNLPKTAADPYQLQQVFVNIINNAQQAMQEAHGGGTLTIRTMPVLRPAGYAHNSTLNLADQPESTMESWIRVEFADDGPGIPPELLTRIFDPFFTTKAPGKGTGLGLSVCHGIVRDHDGHIWAESAPGRGATFILELPVRGMRRAEAEKAAQDRLLELPPGNVLVLDDEEGTLHLLKELLSQHDQKVDTLADGLAAKERIASGNYDVILCDVRIPGFGGDALYEYLKEHRPELIKRLVFITGDTASTQTRAFLRKAGRPVVEKPFDVTELLRIMQNVYRDTRQ